MKGVKMRAKKNGFVCRENVLYLLTDKKKSHTSKLSTFNIKDKDRIKISSLLCSRNKQKYNSQLNKVFINTQKLRIPFKTKKLKKLEKK